MSRRPQVGFVVSFTRSWVRGLRPLRISVVVEHLATQPWHADHIARLLVHRACLLLSCRPRDLKLKSHPADGPIRRRY